MNQITQHLLDTKLKGGSLERAVSQAGMSSHDRGVARSAGFGTAAAQARVNHAKLRAKTKAQKAARRRNR